MSTIERKIYIGSDRWGKSEGNPARISHPDILQEPAYPNNFNFIEYRTAQYKEHSIDTLKPFLPGLRQMDFKVCPVIWFRFSSLFFYEPAEYLPKIEESLAPYKALNKLFGLSIFQVSAFNSKREMDVFYRMIEACPHDYSMALDVSKMEPSRIVNNQLIDHLNKNQVGLVLSNKLVKYASEVRSPYVYYRLDVAMPIPSLRVLLSTVPEQAKAGIYMYSGRYC